jgi:hypothetical protein
MAVATPYLAPAALAALAVFAIQGRWALVAAATVLTTASVAVRVPLFVGDSAPAGTTVRLVSSNLRYGEADPDAVVALARDHADILAVQELTPEEAVRLSAAGLERILPFKALRDRDGPAGVGIWSRYPLSHSTADEDFRLGLLTARVQIPGVRAVPTVVAMHLTPPWPDPIRGCRDDMERLAGVLRDIAAR